MKDIAVLTPPFLVAAVVIIAIVAFLRHEMRRGRAGGADLQDDISVPESIADSEPDSEAAERARAVTPSASDA